MPLLRFVCWLPRLPPLHEPTDRGARSVVVLAQFFGARGETSRLRREIENLLRRLDALLGFENFQKIQSADFDDSRAVAHDDTLEHRRFLAQEHAALVPLQSVRFFNDFDGGAFAEIGFAKIGHRSASRVENLVGFGRRDLDMGATHLDPIDDVLRAETSGVTGRFVQHRAWMFPKHVA